MEAPKNKMSILVGELNRINEENKTLNSMLNHVSASYSDLQKHIRSLVQRKQQLTCIDSSKIFVPHDLSEENFNLRKLSPRSVVHADTAVFHQSYNSWDCPEQDREKEGKKSKFMDEQQLPSKKRKTNYIKSDQTGLSNKPTDDNRVAISQQLNDSSNCSRQVRKEEGKNAKFMDDQQLPSKKRKINYFKLDQTQNGMAANSSMDDGLICDKPPKKKHKLLKKGSNRQTVDCAKIKI